MSAVPTDKFIIINKDLVLKINREYSYTSEYHDRNTMYKLK